MKRLLSLSLVAMFLVLSGCSNRVNLEEAGTHENYGVRMARMNLWREAMFRFKRAVEIDPQDASAHNNLAVAYEANGDFEAAAREYREAMRLDRSNQYIQKNYSRLVEFQSRNKKRERKDAAPAASPSTSGPTTTTPSYPNPPRAPAPRPEPLPQPDPPPPPVSTPPPADPVPPTPPPGGAP